MPQLALPEVFELKKVVLDVFGGGIALVGQQVGDCVDVHVGGEEEARLGDRMRVTSSGLVRDFL